VLSSTGEVHGKLHFRFQLRRTTVPFELPIETHERGALFQLADVSRDKAWRAKVATTKHLSIPTILEMKAQVETLHASSLQLEQWLQYVETHGKVWFKSSREKTMLDRQPIPTNLHACYFQRFCGVPSARKTVLEDRLHASNGKAMEGLRHCKSATVT
jgi:hypothetical protein